MTRIDNMCYSLRISKVYKSYKMCSIFQLKTIPIIGTLFMAKVMSEMPTKQY